MSEMAVVSAGAPMAEESPVSGEASATTLATQISEGEADLTDSRRSLRKRLPRSPSIRGRRVKSCPKSPLMRMAEMRKGGLRSSALRQSGGRVLMNLVSRGVRGGRGGRVKGLGSWWRFRRTLWLGLGVWVVLVWMGSLEKVLLMGCRGLIVLWWFLVKGSWSLELGLVRLVVVWWTLRELMGIRMVWLLGLRRVGGFSGGVDAVMSDDRFPGESETVVAAGSPCRSSGEAYSKMVGQADVFSAGLHSDLSLDLIAAQPLQEMAFIGEQGSTEVFIWEGRTAIWGKVSPL